MRRDRARSRKIKQREMIKRNIMRDSHTRICDTIDTLLSVPSMYQCVGNIHAATHPTQPLCMAHHSDGTQEVSQSN